MPFGVHDHVQDADDRDSCGGGAKENEMLSNGVLLVASANILDLPAELPPEARSSQALRMSSTYLSAWSLPHSWAE